MEAKIKNIDAWTAILTVELNCDELKEHIGAIEKTAAAEIEITGFRKGKAPLETVRQHLDTAKVLQEALGRALEMSLSNAIAANELEVIKVSDLKIKENSAEKLNYSVTLHLYPKVTLPDLAAYSIERKQVNVVDAEVSEALETLRNTRSTFKDIDSSAINGNRVEVDFTVRLDGKIIEGGESKNHPLIIGGKNFMPGFEEELIGLSVGQEKDFSLVAPDDYYQQNLAGKKLDFHVIVRKVQKVECPELTDEFAQSVGQFKNIDQLKTAIRDGLGQEKEQHEHQRVRGQILNELIDGSTISIPQYMVDEQLDAMISDFDRTLHERGMELNMYLSHLKKTQNDLRKEWRKDSEKRVKAALIIREIAKKNHISVTEQDVEAVLGETIQTAISHGQAEIPDVDIARMRQAITERLRNERTLDFVESICVK